MWLLFFSGIFNAFHVNFQFIGLFNMIKLVSLTLCYAWNVHVSPNYVTAVDNIFVYFQGILPSEPACSCKYSVSYRIVSCRHCHVCGHWRSSLGARNVLHDGRYISWCASCRTVSTRSVSYLAYHWSPTTTWRRRVRCLPSTTTLVLVVYWLKSTLHSSACGTASVFRVTSASSSLSDGAASSKQAAATSTRSLQTKSRGTNLSLSSSVPVSMYTGWSDVTVICAHNTIAVVGNMAYSPRTVWSKLVKIRRVIRIKLNQFV